MGKEIQATSEDGKIHYQLLTPKYLDAACDVARIASFTSGNISKALGIPNDPEALAELDKIPRTTALDGISVIAVDKTTDKVVGISCNKLLQPTTSFHHDLRESFKNHRTRRLMDFVITTENASNIFDLCQVDCLMEIYLLGVLPQYRKQGIAKKLCELSVNVAENLFDGVNVKESMDGKELQLEPRPEVVMAVFTSFISQKIGTDLGFKTALEVNNSTMEVMGEPLEKPVEAETPITMVQYKKLN